MANDKLDVLAMANQMASSENDTSNLFKKPEVAPTGDTMSVPNTPAETSKKKEWVPDAALTADMPELQGKPAIYDASELTSKEDEGLRNIADDEAMQNKLDTLNDMERQVENINAFSARHNIRLHIPQGPWQVKFITAANDTNYTKAQQLLDILLNQIKNEIPDAVEYLNPVAQTTESANDDIENTNINAEVTDPEIAGMIDKTQIIIDKRQATDIVWTPDEVAKIRKSRQIELNIVEADDIKFSSIVDADDNAVDTILQQYTRTTNDISSPLPASKYRATFTGLTYPEIIGLQASLEMNSVDAERKKWTIAFNHMTNISIGDWEEYTWYENENHEIVKLNYGAPIPGAYVRHDVTKFEDFLRKTSFMDRDFILWKILCATTTDTEIVSVTCGVVNNNTDTRCGHVYEWVYDPASLLDPNDMDPQVLEEMSEVANAGTKEAALNIYKNGPVSGTNVVTLRESGWSVVYGHASAWDYVEGGIYDAIRDISSKDEDSIRTDDVENTILYTMLNCVKYILVPKPEGGYLRISGTKNLIKMMRKIGPIDFQTLGTIMSIMSKGYDHRFMIKNAVCPKCHGKSTIPVDNMASLLFMIARSLENTVVTLKKQ